MSILSDEHREMCMKWIRCCVDRLGCVSLERARAILGTPGFILGMELFCQNFSLPDLVENEKVKSWCDLDRILGIISWYSSSKVSNISVSLVTISVNEGRSFGLVAQHRLISAEYLVDEVANRFVDHGV